MVLPRFSICQDCAAPFEITSSTWFTSSPAFSAKAMPSESPCTSPAMQTWFTILVSCPAPEGPSSVTARAYESITGLARSNGPGSPPHITVSLPFSAPACPPETGASMKSTPFAFAASKTLRATSADAVVWSTMTAPFFVPASAPSLPRITSITSLSLPTIVITKSQSFAAAAGVGAVFPPCLAAHSPALDAVRL
jgi:hypothetical protein